MKHSIVALSALFAAVQANLFLTNTNFNVKPNEPFTITYNEGGCPAPGCTIEVKSGPSGDLKTAKVLTSAATSTSFSFTPTQDWPSGPLAFEIRNTVGGQNYSPQFPYAGTGVAQSATSSAIASDYPASSTDTMLSTPVTATESSAATPSTLSRLTSSSTMPTLGRSAARNTTAAAYPSSTAGAFHGEESVPKVTSSGDRVAASLALAAGVFAALAYLN